MLIVQMYIYIYLTFLKKKLRIPKPRLLVINYTQLRNDDKYVYIIKHIEKKRNIKCC